MEFPRVVMLYTLALILSGLIQPFVHDMADVTISFLYKAIFTRRCTRMLTRPLSFVYFANHKYGSIKTNMDYIF